MPTGTIHAVRIRSSAAMASAGCCSGWASPSAGGRFSSASDRANSSAAMAAPSLSSARWGRSYEPPSGKMARTPPARSVANVAAKSLLLSLVLRSTGTAPTALSVPASGPSNSSFMAQKWHGRPCGTVSPISRGSMTMLLWLLVPRAPGWTRARACVCGWWLASVCCVRECAVCGARVCCVRRRRAPHPQMSTGRRRGTCSVPTTRMSR